MILIHHQYAKKASEAEPKPSTSTKAANESPKHKSNDKKPSANVSKVLEKKTADENRLKVARDSPSRKAMTSLHALPFPIETIESPKHKGAAKPTSTKVNEKPVRASTRERNNSESTPTRNATKIEPKKVLTPTSSPSNLFSPKKTRSKSVYGESNKPTLGAKLRLASTAVSNGTSKSNAKTKLKLPQLDGADDVVAKGKSKRATKSKPKSEDSDEDSDFEPSPPKRVRPNNGKKPQLKSLAKVKNIDRRVLSTDEEREEDTNTDRLDFWIEAYAEKEKKWIVIDPIKKKVDDVEHIRVS